MERKGRGGKRFYGEEKRGGTKCMGKMIKVRNATTMRDGEREEDWGGREGEVTGGLGRWQR